jgi:hypothetical protein
MKNRALCILLALPILHGCGGDDGSAANSPVPRLLAQTTVVSGLSSAFFSGNRANYTVTRSGTTVTVVDNVGKDGTSTLPNVQRLYFADSALAFDTDGTAGQVYRLYKATFDRQPDLVGLGFQIAAVETSGLTLLQLAQNFAASAEYQQKYGNTTNTQFVTQLYLNALHRSPDDAGLAFHVSYLDQNKISRAQLLYNFSESTENQAQVAGDIQNGITFTAYNVVAPASVPGAPTITSVTAGDASATVVFSAPSSTGGATISSYTASCAGSTGTKTGSATASPIKVSGLTNGSTYACTVTATNSAGTGAASTSMSVTPTAALSGTVTTAGVMCPFSQSVFNSTVKLTNIVSITCSSTLRTISGNGVPDHTTGTFPNSGNPNSISAVTVQYSNTLTPVSTGKATSVAHKIGYANNSVSFDPATAESYQNAGVWKIEALNQTYFPFGVDSSNAHVQPDGTYHYHGIPEGYLTKLGKGTAMTLVGFALDGFPIYARYGYTTATDATSAVKVMTSSYRMKTTPDSGRPSTSTVAMGTFTQDYEYVAGLGDLDECNGRFGVTPEFPNGIYHYYITDTYPYIQRCVKGTPSYNGTVSN